MNLERVKDRAQAVAEIIASANGELVGRTRLQKTAYLLKVAGLGADSFTFSYKHYGPYSEALASATDMSKLFGQINEESKPSSWGGTYSVYHTDLSFEGQSDERKELVQLAKNANPVELELAATAVFLALEGFENAWQETSNRKPDKASKLDGAKELYQKLKMLQTPEALPDI